MKQHLPITLLISAFALSTVFTPVKANLKAASYNITHGFKHDWPKRKAGVCNIIQQIHADIYGLQEVIKENDQLPAIKRTLPGYSYVGKPRSSGVKGLSVWHRLVNFATRLHLTSDEHDLIFYNTKKIKMLDNGTFGINDTGWQSTMVPRICTWALFKDKATHKEFYTYNTHLDNGKQEDRITQIKLVLNDIAKRCDNKPVILMGDFNTTFTGDMQEALTKANFTHARTMAKETPELIGTHMKAKTPVEIDHILVKPESAFNIKTYNICGERSDTTSDHNPVCTTFSFK